MVVGAGRQHQACSTRWCSALGAALAGLAGLMAGPILSVQPGMGEPILILTLVVIVTGGIGSIRGAFYGALIVGIVDTIGRAFLPTLLRELLERTVAQAAGPGDRVDADLPADGRRAGGAARRGCSRSNMAEAVATIARCDRPSVAAARWARRWCRCWRTHGRAAVLRHAVRAHHDLRARRARPQPDPRLRRMVSFGHALYIGIGAYAVGMLVLPRHRPTAGSISARRSAAGACRGAAHRR